MNIFRKYTDCELIQEYKRLQNYVPKELLRNNIGYKCSNAFFQEERFASSTGGKLSAISFWEQRKDKVLAYAETQQKGDLFRHVQFMNHSPSQFPPNVAIWFYKKFKATAVFDPFAGWGDRCLAAIASGVDYTGVDSNKRLRKCYKNMLKFFPHSSRAEIVFKPVEDVDFLSFDFDFVFSSPPFWNKKKKLIELYAGQRETRYDEFMVGILAPLIQYCKRKAWVCLYMPEHMAKDLETIGVKADLFFQYSGAGNKCKQTYMFFCYSSE